MYRKYYIFVTNVKKRLKTKEISFFKHKKRQKICVRLKSTNSFAYYTKPIRTIFRMNSYFYTLISTTHSIV